MRSLPRSRRRDIAACTLQMWAYLAAYKSPHDDPDAQARRVHLDYPIHADRVLGGRGAADGAAAARARPSDRSGPQWRTLDRVLVWAHWSWFVVPHGAVLYVLARRPSASRGPR